MARLSVECDKFLNPSFLQNINPATLLKTQFLHFVSAIYAMPNADYHKTYIKAP